MRKHIRYMTLSAMFIAVGMVLPFLTGQIPVVAKMLLPMHIPVFLCGLICGWKYGASVGFMLPLLRSAVFGMPAMYPDAAAMSLELLTYGLVSGLLYGLSRRQNVPVLYGSLAGAMVSGRIVWALAEIVLLGLNGSAFTWKAFAAGAFVNAVPGIIIQLVLIPAVMLALDRIGLVRFHRPEKEECK